MPTTTGVSYSIFPSRHYPILLSASRMRPYAGHTVRFSTPVSHSGSLSVSSEVELPQTSSTSKRDGTADLLKTLIPALIRDPATYEESISSICTAYNIDPSVVSAINYAVKQGSSSRPLDRYAHRMAF